MSRRIKKIRQKRMKMKEMILSNIEETIVKEANETPDPMSNLECFRHYNRNGLSLTISCSKALDLDEGTRDWAFQLTETNMKDMYNQCDWGWDKDEKHDQLNHESAWYLVARGENHCPQGFVHFRFEVDLHYPVLYCYEIQLESKVQRKGLGKFLMQILQLIAFHLRLEKVMLTVFKHNLGALDFYTKGLGFRIDETSPSMSLEEEEDCYEILSKKIKRKKLQQENN